MRKELESGWSNLWKRHDVIYEAFPMRKKSSSFLLIIFLSFTTYLTSVTFKNIYSNDILIIGSKLFSVDDIVTNSSLKLPSPLISIKTKLTEKELKENLSLENVSVSRQIFPFGLRILIKTRRPIAYGEKFLEGEKINGFIDENGFFINEEYADKENMGKLSIRVLGWDKKFRKILSKIFKSQESNEVEFLKIEFSPNGFLTIEEKNLKTIFLGIEPTIIETQLQIISNIKKQINGNIRLKRIDNIDLTDPNNPKIKVFKP